MPLDHIDLVAFAREEQRGLYVMTGEAMGNGAMGNGVMVSGAMVSGAMVSGAMAVE